MTEGARERAFRVCRFSASLLLSRHRAHTSFVKPGRQLLPNRDIYPKLLWGSCRFS